MIVSSAVSKPFLFFFISHVHYCAVLYHTAPYGFLSMGAVELLLSCRANCKRHMTGIQSSNVARNLIDFSCEKNSLTVPEGSP
jgi:hypothetical protein